MIFHYTPVAQNVQNYCGPGTKIFREMLTCHDHVREYGNNSIVPMPPIVDNLTNGDIFFLHHNKSQLGPVHIVNLW